MSMSQVATPRPEVTEGEFPRPSEPDTSLTVLIVDDSPVDRHLASAIVGRRPGLRAAVAGDGREALELISREPPSVVVTDLQMPGMNGLDLVEEIRRLYPGIPVILMTAHGSEEIAIRALRVGAANYVPKKSLARDLVDTLDRVLAAAAVDSTRQKLLGCVQSSRLQLRLENDSALFPPLIALIQEDLAGMGICDRNETTRVGVALQEALANALYHGNLGVSTELRQDDERVFYQEAAVRSRREPYCLRRIQITVELDRNSATYKIRDEGDGFDTSTLDAPFDPESLMRIGGRGMVLIKTFIDEVHHNQSGNEITLVKRRKSS